MFCSRKKTVPLCPNILTPDQIPSFFIPPSLSSQPEGGGPAGRWLQAKSPNPTPRALLRSASRHVIQVEDVGQVSAGSPDPRPGSTIEDTVIGGRLSESPHTRRRESLFHQMCPAHGRCELKPLSPLDPDRNLSWKLSSHDVHLGFGTPDSDLSSTDSSPYSSPMVNRAVNGGQTPQTFSRILSRETTLTRASSLSTEENSSTDTSPNLPTKEDHANTRVSMAHLLPPPIFHLDFICCQDRLAKETEVTLSRGGLVRLSVEYVKELGHLRVKLVNAENLYAPHQDPKAISCCVVMCFMPGKLQKQRSTVIRRSRNPIFNEDFYFEGVEKGDLAHKRLRVKVINRGAGMKRDVVLGSGELLLSSVLLL
ncbi:C2 calcium-dependent domain-containing protein 4C-like [Gastrophryne carolinensis]